MRLSCFSYLVNYILDFEDPLIAIISKFSSITSWQIDGEKWKQGQILFSWGSKITSDGDCSHKITRCLLRGTKAITYLDSVLKSRDSALPKKVHLVKAMVFANGCESWTIKKAECLRIDAFVLWCWRRLLRVP